MVEDQVTMMAAQYLYRVELSLAQETTALSTYRQQLRSLQVSEELR